MKIMKMKSLFLVLFVSVTGILSGVAHGSVTSLGSTCVEQWLGPNQVGSNNTNGVTYTAGGVLANSYEGGLSTVVVCPVTADHDLGSLAQFSVRVYDGSDPGNYECSASAYNASGTLQATSPEVSSSGMGNQTLNMSIQGVNPSSSWTFAVVCKIPGNPSSLKTIRAY